MRWKFAASVLASLCAMPHARAQKPFDAAAAFGARRSVADLKLSPDGKSVVYLVPGAGQGSAAVTLGLAKGAQPHVALVANGDPDRLGGCNWVSNDRLVCVVYGAVKDPIYGMLPFTRLLAVNADGGNPRLLSTRENQYSIGIQLGGGNVVDWLPDEDGAVLMSREYLPDDHIGSRLGSSKSGLGVDWIDTRTLAVRNVEEPREDAALYLSDGRGTVRIMGIHAHFDAGANLSSVLTFLYRKQGSREWHELGDYDALKHSGFYPEAVDPVLDVAYGFEKKDGRQAFYSVALDGSMRKSLVHARPDVDLDGMMRIGRRRRVVGISYATDYEHAVYFDPEIAKLVAAFGRALGPQKNITIVDSSADENELLVLASSDHDPGVYYLFDRKSGQLRTFFVVRSPLEGIKLATVTPIRYPATDGTMIPAYLTLPPGQETAKGLPAIVLPHGGPAERDEWGFDWLAQFFAARGFAVLQPNYRGSTGYGDAWYGRNGFRSWRTSIGDVLDAGRWLVGQGIADPAKLGIVGWSYGGYAALQSAVVDPGEFKAVVAIAPVTDLNLFKEERRRWTDFDLVSRYVGSGPQVREGSPAENAAKIKAPVLMFHGEFDFTVPIEQSQRMADRLGAAGVAHQLVTWKDLDHQLDDSAARTQMLGAIDAFLRKSMGMN